MCKAESFCGITGSAITGPIGKECADLWPRIASAANAIVWGPEFYQAGWNVPVMFCEEFCACSGWLFCVSFPLFVINCFSLPIMQVTGSPMAIWAIEVNFCLGFHSLKALKVKSVISDCSFLRDDWNWLSAQESIDNKLKLSIKLANPGTGTSLWVVRFLRNYRILLRVFEWTLWKSFLK